ncbi:MAG: flagellar hook-length control protein FliK [bacterium]
MLNPGQNIFDLLLGGNNLTGLPSSSTTVEPVADVLFDDVLAGLATTVGSNGNIIDIPAGATPCQDQEVLLPIRFVENRSGEILPESQRQFSMPVPGLVREVSSEYLLGSPGEVTIPTELGMGIVKPRVAEHLQMPLVTVESESDTGVVEKPVVVSEPRNAENPLVFARVGQSAKDIIVRDRRATTGQPRLDSFVSRLNLTEIEITPANDSRLSAVAGESTPKAAVPDSESQMPIIQSFLPRLIPAHQRLMKVKETSQGTKEDGAAARAVTMNDTELSIRPVTPADAVRLVSVDNGSRNPLMNESTAGGGKSVMEWNQATTGMEKQDFATITELSTTPPARGSERHDIQPVRFTLPENIHSTLQPNGRAVTLRIQPDNLGPAKLTLSMMDGRLRARVVVGDFAAKAAVEASLDRLVEQLSLAKIEVDHIEVTVGGENTRDELLQRHRNFRYRSGRADRFNLNDVLGDSESSATTVPMPPPSSYVGSSGVNLLA